jgi:hypothetical protein
MNSFGSLLIAIWGKTNRDALRGLFFVKFVPQVSKVFPAVPER